MKGAFLPFQKRLSLIQRKPFFKLRKAFLQIKESLSSSAIDYKLLSVYIIDGVAFYVLLSSMIRKNSLGDTTLGVLGKCFELPVIGKESGSDRLNS